jgi:glutathione S-transferase
MKLYWHPFSIFPRRVQIALREKGIDCEEVEVDLPGGALRGPEFRRLNPFGQVPVLQDGDLVIAESIAILEYIEERYPTPALMPTGAANRAVVRQFMLCSGDYLAPAWKAWVAPRFSTDVRPDDPSVQQGRDMIAVHLDVLGARLQAATWLVGDYSLADIGYAPLVTLLDLVGLGDLIRARPVVQAWIERLAARPAVRDTAPAFAS